MAEVTKMPKDVEQRIRALPGNNVCVDCSNLNPQWASVSYGCLMCLECSGQHRSIGVHLSFVRSIAMDSWKPREIEAMDKSGGNQCLIDFFQSKGIAKEMAVATKYGTKQADYYKNRLSRWLDGRREPPPDPGRYDPATGGSDAQGAEPLPGETTAQYNERQSRLREAARERMREKFGGGMSGMGSGGQMGGMGSPQQDDDNFWGALGGKLGGAVSGIGSFVKEKVIENDELKAKVGGITRRATDSELFGAIQRNVTAQEGSVVRKSMGWATGTAGAVASGLFESGSCENGHSMRIENQPEIRCDDCKAIGTRYVCSRGCGFVQCQKCFEKPPTHCIPADSGGGSAARLSGGSSRKSGNWDDDDDWGVSAPEPEKDIAQIQRELGMNLSVSGAPVAPSPGAGTPAANGASTPSPVAFKPPMAQTSAAAEPKPKAKPKAGLQSEDDFFADFGM